MTLVTCVRKQLSAYFSASVPRDRQKVESIMTALQWCFNPPGSYRTPRLRSNQQCSHSGLRAWFKQSSCNFTYPSGKCPQDVGAASVGYRGNVGPGNVGTGTLSPGLGRAAAAASLSDKSCRSGDALRNRQKARSLSRHLTALSLCHFLGGRASRDLRQCWLGLD
jgi:hypothetical protein